MATTKININGISEIDFTNGIASVSNTDDVTTITLAALGVTSVAFTAPTEFIVSGSPITSSGTIALTWQTESANRVFAGPSSGAAAIPTFRALVAADIPALGYVTSVALTAPTEITVGGSPITSSGTIALTWTNESANRVFAGPSSGGASTPSFRALVAADIPALPYVTGTSLTAGQLIVGAGSSAIAVGNLSGDVTTAGSTAATVIKLRGAALDASIGTAGAGQDGYVIYWDNASSSYKLKLVSGGSFGPSGNPAVGAGTAYSNSGSSATATASVTINVGDFVLVVSGNPNGAAAVTISDNGTALVLTSVVSGANGTAIYTGTITGGASNAHAGKVVTIAGFTNQGTTLGENNGSFMCVASSATTLTLLNAYAATETHAGTAASTYYKLSSIGNANFTNADCLWVCYSALVSATSITTTGVTNPSIAAATFTGVGGIGAFSGNLVTTTPGTNSITTTVANSLVVTGFLYVSTAGTITASSSTGTLRTNSNSGTNTFLGTAIVTTQATTTGSYTNAVALNRTATTGICWTLELLPSGTQFDSNPLQIQNAYWNGGAAVTDTWSIKAALTPSQSWMPALFLPSFQQGIVNGNGRTVGLVPMVNRLELDFSGEGGPLFSTPSQTVLGSIFLQKIQPVLTPTVTPTGGSATTWNYKVLGFDANNMPTEWSTSGTTAAGAATLVPGTAFNTVTWSQVPGVAYYQLARQIAGAGNFVPVAFIPATSAATLTYVDDGATASTVALTTTGSINWSGGINFDGTWLTSTPTTLPIANGLAILTGSNAFTVSLSGWTPASGSFNPNTSWTNVWQLGFGTTSDSNDRLVLNTQAANYSISLNHSRTTATGNPGIGLGGGNWTITTGTAVEVSIGTSSGSEQTASANFVPATGTGAYTGLRIIPTINQALRGPYAISNCNITSATSVTLTVAANTLQNAATIVIAGCTGTNNAQLNGTWTVASGGGTTTVVVTGSGWTTGNHAEATGTISQQATGAYSMILVNPTVTATGAAASLNTLLDLQVNSVSQFRIDSTGKIVVPSTNTATSANAGANGAVPAQVVGYLIINVNGTNVKVPYFAT